jgi:DNA-binding MarR family transcriptional regulator
MNQSTQTRARHASTKNPPPNGSALGPADAAVHAQALELDSIFKSLARKVLVDDDPAAEMPLGQLRVCLALYEDSRSMTQLSRELGVSQSAITQIADRLQGSGMVTRSPAGDDRRVRSLQLTSRARKILRLREENRIGRVVALLNEMPAEARDNVLTALSALSEACND